MRVIQSKFTKTKPKIFSNGGGGGTPGVPVLDPPLKAVLYRGLSLFVTDPSPFLQFMDLPKECANLNSISLEI